MKIVWDMDQATSDWTELVDLSLDRPDLTQAINLFLYSGASFLPVDLDESATESTGYAVARYKLADELKVLLLAARAENIQTHEI